MVEFVLGFAAGIVTNLIAWWLLFHFIVPNMRFSPAIGKVQTEFSDHDRSGYLYRIKFENAGRRSIIDLELIARLRIKGLSKHKTTWQVLNVPLSPDGERTYRIPVVLPVRKGRAVRHVITLFTNSAIAELDRAPYPEEIQKKARERQLLLEDLLSLSSDATVQLLAFGYDEFSGARKLFLSKRYTIDDIKRGPFAKDGLNVKEKLVEDQGTQESGISDEND